MSKSVSTVNRERRHTEAVERQKKYDAMNLEDRIKMLQARSGNSFKQLTRLLSK